MTELSGALITHTGKSQDTSIISKSEYTHFVHFTSFEMQIGCSLFSKG
jgi:hypothetical protein